MSPGTHLDPTRRYSAEEEERLARQLYAIAEKVDRGQLMDRPADPGLLLEFHGTLFSGVRDHAGQCRKSGFGQEHLTSGPNRSVHRSKVVATLETVFEKLRVSLVSLDANRTDPKYEESAFHIAIWAHAEVIRIHPFEDGNGRCSRLLLNWVLVRAGLRPIHYAAPRQEYLDCLNRYFQDGRIENLIALWLRFADEQL